MAASIETRRRLRAIRRLSSGFPDRTAEERLEKIAGIASGKLDPSVARPNRVAPPPVPAEEPEDEKKRKKKGGHDRQERGGMNRSSDVNL